MARFETLNVGTLRAERIVGGASLLDFPTSGKKIYVHSGTGSDGGGSGDSPDKPFASVFGTAGALAQCTASKGDVIIVLAGHAETLTTALGIINKAGVSIFGMGNGTNRPTFTVNSATNGVNIRANNVRIDNCRFVSGATLLTATLALARLMKIGKPAAIISDVTISNCEFYLSAGIMRHAVVVGNSTGTGMQNISFLNCVFENAIQLNSTTGLVHPKSAILIRGGNLIEADCFIDHCRFIDTEAWAAEGWDYCVNAGGIGDVIVNECIFICRGVAVRARSAGVSPQLAIIRSQGISTSTNTAVANIFQATYANIVDSYVVGAVNKRAKMVPAATEA